MKLIALAGKAGSGKDTVADRLCAVHGFVRYEFARLLKAMLNAIGVDANNRETKELPHPVFGVSPRKMAQTLGTEWMRQTICAEGWLLLAGEFIDSVEPHPGFSLPNRGIVITDCRFANEAAFIAARDGVIWHVQRPGVQDVEAHSSESGLEVLPGDAVIINDASIARLFERVDACIADPAPFTRPY